MLKKEILPLFKRHHKKRHLQILRSEGRGTDPTGPGAEARRHDHGKRISGLQYKIKLQTKIHYLYKIWEVQSVNESKNIFLFTQLMWLLNFWFCQFHPQFNHSFINQGSMCPIDLSPVNGGGFYLPLRLLSVEWVAKNANGKRNKANKLEAVDNPLKMQNCDLIITFVSQSTSFCFHQSTIFMLHFLYTYF